ncbi:MAG: class I SAM-dependent methyltransferase [Phycisphaerales bacterium]
MLTRHTCPVCESPRVSHAFDAPTTRSPRDGRRWSIWRCADCTHGFLNPQLSWDDLAPFYSAGYSAYSATEGLERGLEATVEEARRRGEYRHVPVRSGTRLLDFGSGGGAFLEVVGRLGVRARGVEPSEHAARACRERGLDVFHGDIFGFAAAEPGARFDLITASHVIEHTPDPVPVLRAMGTLLAPGGFIWIAVPNAGGFTARRLRGRWHSTDVPLHLMQFTPASARAGAERAGLRVRSLCTYTLPAAMASSLDAMLRQYLLMPAAIRRPFRPLVNLPAPALARRLDRRGDGEAILMEMDTGP